MCVDNFCCFVASVNNCAAKHPSALRIPPKTDFSGLRLYHSKIFRAAPSHKHMWSMIYWCARCDMEYAVSYTLSRPVRRITLARSQHGIILRVQVHWNNCLSLLSNFEIVQKYLKFSNSAIRFEAEPNIIVFASIFESFEHSHAFNVTTESLIWTVRTAVARQTLVAVTSGCQVIKAAKNNCPQ